MQSEAPSEGDLIGALTSVLAAEARENISAHLLLEIWLADVLARTFPRSDPLIRTAIGSFGWDKLHHGGMDPVIATVLRRRLFLENMVERTALETALKGHATPDKDRLLDRLHRVLDEEVLYDVHLGPQLEAWLAGLIVDTLPRSDALIGVAVARFGWRADPDHPVVNPDVAEVVRRFQVTAGQGSGRTAKRSKLPLDAAIGLVYIVLLLVGMAWAFLSGPSQLYPSNASPPQPRQALRSPGESTVTNPDGGASAQRGLIHIRTIGNPLFPYSKRALRDKIYATVTLNCIVLTDGQLGHCLVVKETPSGYGFGKLSLSAVKYDVADLTDSRGYSTVGIALPVVMRWGPPHAPQPLPAPPQQAPFDEALSSEPPLAEGGLTNQN
ncbi:MAG TPA: hypothetical protein VHZ26_09395 [Caulobacteraceae bacterium]|jgi:hypothetical protein|nr:hypothetical protein [Caulobacteraceae bacterium]